MLELGKTLKVRWAGAFELGEVLKVRWAGVFERANSDRAQRGAVVELWRGCLGV